MSDGVIRPDFGHNGKMQDAPDVPAEVIDLDARRDGWLSGPVVCAGCQNEWVAVTPAGENQLECPQCHRWLGARKGLVVPSGPTWRCDCGEYLFWLTADGAVCRMCGVYAVGWCDGYDGDSAS